MFPLFQPKLPVDERTQEWVEDGFARLIDWFGIERMGGGDAENPAARIALTPVMLPDIKHFPQPFDGTDVWADMALGQVCRRMEIDRDRIDLHWFEIERPDDDLSKSLPFWSNRGSGGPAGFYRELGDDGRARIALNRNVLADPMAAISTIAHEAAHVLLLGGGMTDREQPDMEPLTDLATIFFGFGIFTGNSAFQFSQWQDDRRGGWRIQRLGYLTEPICGYALARWAHLRGETRPDWSKRLKLNVREYMKHTAAWLQRCDIGSPKRRPTVSQVWPPAPGRRGQTQTYLNDVDDE